MQDLFNALGPTMMLGLISAALSTVAYLPYIRDTLAGRTKPQRASWLIWSALSIIAFASQAYEGATGSIWFAGAQVLGTVIICVLSVRRGVGGFLSRRDAGILGLAAFGLVAWYLTDTAAYALAITISISLLGGSMTVLKAYQSPNSETLSTWLVSFFASACAILAVGSPDWVLLAYPVYLFTLNGAIVVATMAGRARDRALATTW